MPAHVIISNSQDLRRFLPQDIVYIRACGNYVDVHTIYDEQIGFTLQLGKIEEMIHDQLRTEGMNFIRLGRSVIINSDYISHINPRQGILVLRDCKGKAHDIKGVNQDALHNLMEFLNKEVERRKREE